MLDLSPEMLTLLMFGGLLFGLFLGHPLAFVLAASRMKSAFRSVGSGRSVARISSTVAYLAQDPAAS